MNETNPWIRIAYCRDIPLREGRAVRVGSREIAIFNLGDRFLAVDNHCPHKGGPLADGILSGTSVVCPLHAWKMCLESGKGVSGPSVSGCVRTFRTRVENEIVLLELANAYSETETAPTGQLPVICAQTGGGAGTMEYPSAAEV
jgi:nitrite reductase (NADH) small subunit